MNSTPEADSSDAANEVQIRDSVPLKSAEASSAGMAGVSGGTGASGAKLWECIELAFDR